MGYSLFVPNVVKHVVVADFGQKNCGRFRDGADTKKPEKARKIKKIRRFVMNLRTGLSDKTWTCGLYHPNGVRLVCKSANIVEYLPISLIFRGFRLLFGKYRLPKKCTRCRKNTILYQNLVPDFSAFQGFCGFCLKELYHIFLQKSSAESYLFEN